MEEIMMRQALEEAGKALEEGEVPVGCVIEIDGKVIGSGHNEVEGRGLCTAHAEMTALAAASGAVGDWRLDGATAYVTVEPCYMCMGAFYLARVGKVVFGAKQPRSGACGSAGDLCEKNLYGHDIEVKGGVLEEESVLLLQKFFARLRIEEKDRRDARAG